MSAGSRPWDHLGEEALRGYLTARAADPGCVPYALSGAVKYPSLDALVSTRDGKIIRVHFLRWGDREARFAMTSDPGGPCDAGALEATCYLLGDREGPR